MVWRGLAWVGVVSQAQTTQVTDESGRRVRNTCPVYHFGAAPPRPEILQRARAMGVSLRHFDVMPLLLDDLHNALNFYDQNQHQHQNQHQTGEGARVEKTVESGDAGEIAL